MLKGRSKHDFLLPLILFLIISSSISEVNAWEIDLESDVERIIDGDTFEISEWYEPLDRYERVRLADVSAPEPEDPGGSEATQILSNFIDGKTVYLDTDPDRDPYDRLVAVVYIIHNSTHYMNVNKALLSYDEFYLDNHDNEFNPYQWTLFVQYAELPSPPEVSQTKIWLLPDREKVEEGGDVAVGKTVRVIALMSDPDTPIRARAP